MIKITCINNNIIYNLSTGKLGEAGGVGLLSHIFLVCGKIPVLFQKYIFNKLNQI